MVLTEKKIDSSILALYGCEDNGEKVIINCYDNSSDDLEKALRFSKSIDNLTGTHAIGQVYNSVTCERLKPYPLGVNRCNLEHKTLYIFSNEFDLFTVAQAYPMTYNMIAIVNNLSSYESLAATYDFISNYQRIVLVPTLKSNCKRWIYEMEKRIQGEALEVLTVDMGLLETYRSINDYLIHKGEKLASEMIKTLIESPIDIGIDGVIDITSVKKIDRSKLKRVYSKLDFLDGKLGGGICQGEVVLLTGAAGNGKSEFASQLALAAVEQGFNTFYYVGEEGKEKLLSRLQIKLSEERHIHEKKTMLYGGRESKFDKEMYIDGFIAEKINRWLKGKLFAYDGEFKQNKEVEDLINILTESHIRKNCQVFFLDNLMSMTSKVRSIELYQKQSEIVSALVDFSKKYDVIVVLLAHPSKSSGQEIELSGISGSFNIVNLASTVLTIRRTTPEEKEEMAKGPKIYDSYMSCIKNRSTGIVFNKYGLMFNRKNKTFSPDGMYSYDWDNSEQIPLKIELTQEEIDELPF